MRFHLPIMRRQWRRRGRRKNGMRGGKNGRLPHRHLHMMINRIHPETGKAYDLFQSHRRFDRIMQLLADEYGFLYVPPHNFHPEATDDLPKRPGSNATYASRRGAPTNRPQWPRRHSRAYGRLLSERLDTATSWDDLEQMFAEDGYTLEWKGRGKKAGLVVGDTASYTKFSALGLSISAKGLEKRFGRKFKPQRPSRRAPPKAKARAWAASRNVFNVDAVDIARAVGTKAQLRHAAQEAVGARKARLARASLSKQLEAELREVLKASTSLTPPCRAKSRRPSPTDNKPDRSRSGR